MITPLSYLRTRGYNGDMKVGIRGMKLIPTTVDHATLVGEIHSLAWQQAYEELFPAEYIDAETSEKRKQEFTDALQDERYRYFLVYEENICVGMVKTLLENGDCEIASIYILKEYCGRGLGSRVIAQLIEMYKDYCIFLWTLEENYPARKFYEKNGFEWTGDIRTIFRGRDFLQVKYKYIGNME